MKLNQLRSIWRLAAAFALICVACWVHAQNTTSCAITGTVDDSTGAVAPEVQVAATNQATGLSHTETTNDSGFYDAESLAPGDYSVTTNKGRIQNAHRQRHPP